MPPSLPSSPSLTPTKTDETLRFFPEKKVGILGAGALILDSLDVECEILEASDRIGGHLSTRKFPRGKVYDYYVGFSSPRRGS
ncbi:hypothetical protein BKA82DRAFT_1003027 [Pisolithus tinctorius]|uniref:Amine oxidase domain-containing protein n=1 Tax=Pisolithus tinctorius Marx 270 TaxID=870435 RepID=A0A0C3P2V4_PISTI|nr:hypothetical protein BKA82DRAFT_1003027 [Pisolithus tinctorius]KIO01634.1 hypothetical protein M404DRAFT_1003027 [Pisolithus tinctorius Marx 270]